MRKIVLKNVVWKEGNQYVSWNLNTGVSSFGDTKKEALDALQEALGLYFEDMPVSCAQKIERPDIVHSVFCYTRTFIIENSQKFLYYFLSFFDNLFQRS